MYKTLLYLCSKVEKTCKQSNFFYYGSKVQYRNNNLYKSLKKIIVVETKNVIFFGELIAEKNNLFLKLSNNSFNNRIS